MSKGLEAFNRIKSYFHPKQLLTKEMTLNDLNTIEKELKEKAELQKLLEHERELNDHLILHEVKALEIIKNKQVVIPRLLCWRDLSDYNFPLLPKYWLEQEEYDLLKEVLL